MFHLQQRVRALGPAHRGQYFDRPASFAGTSNVCTLSIEVQFFLSAFHRDPDYFFLADQFFYFYFIRSLCALNDLF